MCLTTSRHYLPFNQHPPKKRHVASFWWFSSRCRKMGAQSLIFQTDPLGCPRKLGSMASRWVVSPTSNWGMLMYTGGITLWSDPNLLLHKFWNIQVHPGVCSAGSPEKQLIFGWSMLNFRGVSLVVKEHSPIENPMFRGKCIGNHNYHQS